MDFLKLFSSKSSPKEVATDRLRLILIHDRASVSPQLLEKIRDELLNVVSKYIEIADGDVDIRMAKTEEIEEGTPALIANIPIKKIKDLEL